MSNRFTDRADRVVLITALEEAKRLNHDYLAPEHILLGLLAFDGDVVADVLYKLKANPKAIRAVIERVVGVGDNIILLNEIPFTPLAKKVLACAGEEAQSMGDSYVGTEHLLLGLLRVTDGVAAQVLIGMGITLDRVQQAIKEVFDDPTTKPLNFPPNSSVEVGGTKEVPKTLLDTVFTKTVYIDGKKMGCCTRVVIDCDVAERQTEVTVTFVIAKNSLRISDNKISFDLLLLEEGTK